MSDTQTTAETPDPVPTAERKENAPVPQPAKMPKEIGGPAGPEPTRYGDWEQKGRCTDF
jgi:hypothetical protein